MFRHAFDLTYRLQSPEEAEAARREYRRQVREIEEDIDLVQRYEDEALVHLDQQWSNCLAEWDYDETTVRAFTRWGAARRARRLHAEADGITYAGRTPSFALLGYRLAARRVSHGR